MRNSGRKYGSWISQIRFVISGGEFAETVLLQERIYTKGSVPLQIYVRYAIPRLNPPNTSCLTALGHVLFGLVAISSLMVISPLCILQLSGLPILLHLCHLRRRAMFLVLLHLLLGIFENLEMLSSFVTLQLILWIPWQGLTMPSLNLSMLR